MFDIGWAELLFLGLIVLLVLGPGEMPNGMHTIGRYSNHLRKIASEFKSNLDTLDAQTLLDEPDQTTRPASQKRNLAIKEDLPPDLFSASEEESDPKIVLPKTKKANKPKARNKAQDKETGQ
jgi:sec-independent protein translocase protein TatB